MLESTDNNTLTAQQIDILNHLGKQLEQQKATMKLLDDKVMQCLGLITLLGAVVFGLSSLVKEHTLSIAELVAIVFVLLLIGYTILYAARFVLPPQKLSFPVNPDNAYIRGNQNASDYYAWITKLYAVQCKHNDEVVASKTFHVNKVIQFTSVIVIWLLLLSFIIFIQNSLP